MSFSLIGAQVYITLEQFDRAIEDCNQAISLNPAYVKAYMRKAVAQMEQT